MLLVVTACLQATHLVACNDSLLVRDMLVRSVRHVNKVVVDSA